jgi:hypothetical protein
VGCMSIQHYYVSNELASRLFISYCRIVSILVDCKITSIYLIHVGYLHKLRLVVYCCGLCKHKQPVHRNNCNFVFSPSAIRMCVKPISRMYSNLTGSDRSIVPVTYPKGPLPSA